MTPVMIVSRTNRMIAGRSSRVRSENMWNLLSEADGDEGQVNELDSDEWDNQSADAVDKQIVAEQGGGVDGAIFHAAEGKRNKEDDDQRVENDRRKYRTVGRRQMHDVEPVEHGVGGGEGGWDDREILGDVVGDAEGG